MPVEITRMIESDIDGAVDCIQKAFAEDPYFAWVFTESFSPARNRVSLGIRCRWGLEHALFYVAKDPSSSTPARVLGVACWLPPTNSSAPQSWKSWFGDWSLWLNQVWMNSVYGRGGLNVRRYYIWKAAQSDAQRQLWTDDQGYYFCNIVTVLPECQSLGIGKGLFEIVMRRADAEG
ncbi:acyl-CoA N-acyltransferase, partial [Aureobasidium melanogenum]